MIKIYIVSILLFPLFAFAEPNQDFKDVRAFIEAQKENENSYLNQQVQILMSEVNLPAESHFNIYGPELLLVGPQQTYHDCEEKLCKAYERNFFRQFGEIRFEGNYPSGSVIQIWRISILVQVLRIWTSDPHGSHLQSLKNEISISSVIFQ